MMAVPQSGSAKVYHSGRRRYLTLKAACRDAARVKVKAALLEMGADPFEQDEWWCTRVDRLSRLYLRWARISEARQGDDQ